MCTLPSANVARTCRTIESPMTTASQSVSQRGAKRFRDEMSKTGGGEVVARGLDRIFRCCTQGPWFPGAGVKAICDDRVPGARGPVQRNTRSRGGGSVSSVLHTYPGLMSVSPRCFQRSFPFPQLGLFPKQLVDPSLHGHSLNVSSPAHKGRHKSAIKAK